MKSVSISIIFLSLVASAFAQDASTLRKKSFNLEKAVAIQGYDPVAYFKQNKAVKGNSQFAASYEGITYYFSSTENKEAFAKSPASYEPQYGGWCAFAMGNSGEKVEIDPSTFKILNGKLYLFYNKFFNNTLKSWNKDETNLRTKADANWQKIYH
jgi:YHS domain-containing protein